jgi:propanediol dehydratase small subunit
MSDEQISKLIERMAQSKGVTISPELVKEALKRVVAAVSESSKDSQAPTGKGPTGKGPTGKGLDPKKDYPLGQKRRDLIRTATGLSLDEITLDKVTSGKITFGDLKIRPETLEYQAQIAEACGRPQLASNIRRAAELTRLPDERVLEIYESLRPYRSTKKEMLEIANELESRFQARICAALVREAAEVYEKRGRLRKE